MISCSIELKWHMIQPEISQVYVLCYHCQETSLMLQHTSQHENIIHISLTPRLHVVLAGTLQLTRSRLFQSASPIVRFDKVSIDSESMATEWLVTVLRYVVPSTGLWHRNHTASNLHQYNHQHLYCCLWKGAMSAQVTP